MASVTLRDNFKESLKKLISEMYGMQNSALESVGMMCCSDVIKYAFK